MMNTEIPYEIRWARTEEWAPAMKMIWRTFMKFEGDDYTEEGIQSFFDFISDDKLYNAFLRGTYQMLVAVSEGQVIGAASVRNCNHLSLLFVDEKFHHKGVGAALMTKMCDYLKTEAGERYMSLQASPYAVNFYRRLGFRAVAPEEEYSGIRVTPMEKIL